MIGDATPAFALSTFFPERAKTTIEKICEITWKVYDSCGLVIKFTAVFKTMPSMPQLAQLPQIPQLSKKNDKEKSEPTDQKKKALQMLEDEIKKKL